MKYKPELSSLISMAWVFSPVVDEAVLLYTTCPNALSTLMVYFPPTSDPNTTVALPAVGFGYTFVLLGLE
jgi:hypothetical protein